MREWLIEIRKSQKMTQEKVALTAGICRPYYTRIERGEHKVPPETAMKIAGALGFDWTKFYMK